MAKGDVHIQTIVSTGATTHARWPESTDTKRYVVRAVIAQRLSGQNDAATGAQLITPQGTISLNYSYQSVNALEDLPGVGLDSAHYLQTIAASSTQFPPLHITAIEV